MTVLTLQELRNIRYEVEAKLYQAAEEAVEEFQRRTGGVQVKAISIDCTPRWEVGKQRAAVVSRAKLHFDV